MDNNKLRDRMIESSNIDLRFTNKLIEHIAEQGYSDKYGARNINRTIQDIVEDKIADETAKLYKKEKYNALVSLVPLVVQILLLVGMRYI